MFYLITIDEILIEFLLLGYPISLSNPGNILKSLNRCTGLQSEITVSLEGKILTLVKISEKVDVIC